MNRLYVGNIRFTADEASLRTLFEAFGPVQEVYIGIDRETGRSRGFAFVTMGDPASAQAARNGLHGKEVDGRVLVVNEAQPRQARGPGDGGPPRDRGPARGADRGGSRDWSQRPSGRGDAPSGRQSSRFASSSDGPSSGRQSSGGRPSKGGKQSGRDREWDRERDRERDRDKQKFDREDEW